jgi:predicted aspartyl protease
MLKPAIADNGVLTIPLSYKPALGVYTTQILIGQNKIQEVEAIVDTGSSSIVVVAPKKLCKRCANSLTIGAVDPNLLTPVKNNTIKKISYGSAIDHVNVYLAPIKFKHGPKYPLNTKLFVIFDSTQPSNIIGLNHANLIKNQHSFTTFMKLLHHHFDTHHIFSFLLCGDKAKSYFYLGKKSFKVKKGFTAPLDTKNHYTIPFSGIYDAVKKPIATTQFRHEKAIIDTGTGGLILLNENLFDKITTYIYTHTNKHNQTIGSPFWKKNYCAKKNSIDIEALPALMFGFKKLNGAGDFYLKFTPQSYISQAGCDKGYARLVFTKSILSNNPVAKRNHQLRKHVKSYPAMVIGTSLLNDYATLFHLEKTPRVDFFPNDHLCNIPKH